MNRVIRYFPNSDLRCMHDGLVKIAREHKIDCSKLKQGEFIFFANSKFDKLKIFCSGNMICYIKAPNGRLSMDAIRYLPLTFNGTEFNYDRAVRKALDARGLKIAA